MFRLMCLMLCLLIGCSDNNETAPDMSEDMSNTDLGSDQPNEMGPVNCDKDGQTYNADEEVCLARQLFKCTDGVLVDLQNMCGDPFDVDIQISNLKGMSGQVGNIDSVYVKGTLSNLGTMDALNIECYATLALNGDPNASKALDINGPLFKAGESIEIEIVKNTDLGKGKTATFEYECTAENEDEEAKSIGNYKKITFTY